MVGSRPARRCDGGSACRKGDPKGRPRAGAVQELQPDVRIDVRLLPARRRVGADELPPDAGRGRLSGAGERRIRHDLPQRLSRARRDRAAGRTGDPLRDLHRALEFRRRLRRACGGPHVPARYRGGRGARRSVLVLLHLRHDRAPEGRRAHPWPDGLRDHEPSLRPDARHDPCGCLAGGRAALAWGGGPSARAGGARGEDDPFVERPLRYRRGLDIGGALARDEPVHGADDRQAPDRASLRRRARPFLPALCHLCRRAHVPGGSEARAQDTRKGAGAVFRPRRGDRQHHRAAAGAP